MSPLVPARDGIVQQVGICRRVEMGQLGEMNWLFWAGAV